MNIIFFSQNSIIVPTKVLKFSEKSKTVFSKLNGFLSKLNFTVKFVAHICKISSKKEACIKLIQLFFLAIHFEIENFFLKRLS